jgi:hypothetical protein
MSTKSMLPTHSEKETCLDVAKFERLHYFFGQMLGVGDFRAEQTFFREKLKLHNRCLHGYGTLCGLLVEPIPIPKQCISHEEEEEIILLEELKKLLAAKAAAPPPAPAAAPTSDAHAAAPVEPPHGSAPDPDVRIEELRRLLCDFYKKHCIEEPRTRIRITCGIALDCHGNELVLRECKDVDLLEWLSPEDFNRVKQGAHTLYVSICYCEHAMDGARPVLSDPCGAAPDCNYTRISEGVHVRVTVDEPLEDCRCNTCCTPCKDCCLLLARIDSFCPGLPLFEHDIHNHVRRHLHTDYQPTVITGISWKNGHHYTQEEAKHLMGTREHRGEHRSRGLEIHFSNPVRASTIHPGVMDTWVIEGGHGRSGNIYNKSGEFVDKPSDGLIHHLFYRDTSGETLEPGDRVLVILRTEFILDHCCRPVDGLHVGGRVPLLKEYAERFHIRDHYEECRIPPYGYGPWTSGIGAPCGGFQSWFFIREGEEEHERR